MTGRPSTLTTWLGKGAKKSKVYRPAGTASEYLPVTHGLRAARRVADGAALSDVRGLLAAELAIGLAYGALGFLWLRHLEVVARRGATLENT